MRDSDQCKRNQYPSLSEVVTFTAGSLLTTVSNHFFACLAWVVLPGNNAPVSIVFEVIRTRKPLHLTKVVITEIEMNYKIHKMVSK